MRRQFLKNSSYLIASYIAVLFLCLTGCQSSEQQRLRYVWSYDDMVRECKQTLSVEVKVGNDTKPHKFSFVLSTSVLSNRNVYVHTDKRIFTARIWPACFYQGISAVTADSVLGSLINGVLKMTFKFNERWYAVLQQLNNTTKPAIAQVFQFDKETNLNLDQIATSHLYSKKSKSSPSDAHIRRKRSLKLQSAQNSYPQKVLELAIVIDQGFVNNTRGEGNAVIRVLEITNFVNGFFERLGLKIILTDIVIWSRDPFPMSTNATENLRKFSIYAATQVDLKYDIIILLSFSLTAWNNGIIRETWHSGACSQLKSAGVILDKHSEAISTAQSMAHEIGYNLGLKHDEEVAGCACSSVAGCIMNSYTPNIYLLQVLNWSTCSVEAWNSQVNETWRACLSDVPAASYHSSRGIAYCGNGILETGEQCDCGPAQTCRSKCCNATTCQFKPGAWCASGPCCDSNSCTLRRRGDICRSAVGVCDVPETCSGSSEWCPSDDMLADGVECARGQAYCFKGQCKTTDAQCQLLLSPSATTAPGICFSSRNTRGDKYGHCHMKLQSVSYNTSVGFNLSYSFIPCVSADTGCGLLHCVHRHPKPPNSKKRNVNITTCFSPPLIDLSSSGLRSPSLVPDGAKCGENSMCLNSTCTPVSSLTNCSTCPNCHNNGVLTVSNVCFCNSKFAPPNCISAGCGGSVTSPLACSDFYLSTSTQWVIKEGTTPTALSHLALTMKSTADMVEPTVSHSRDYTKVETSAPRSRLTTTGLPQPSPASVPSPTIHSTKTLQPVTSAVSTATAERMKTSQLAATALQQSRTTAPIKDKVGKQSLSLLPTWNSQSAKVTRSFITTVSPDIHSMPISHTSKFPTSTSHSHELTSTVPAVSAFTMWRVASQGTKVSDSTVKTVESSSTTSWIQHISTSTVSKFEPIPTVQSHTPTSRFVSTHGSPGGSKTTEISSSAKTIQHIPSVSEPSTSNTHAQSIWLPTTTEPTTQWLTRSNEKSKFSSTQAAESLTLSQAKETIQVAPTTLITISLSSEVTTSAQSIRDQTVQSSTEATTSVSSSQRTVHSSTEATTSVLSSQRTVHSSTEATSSVSSTQRTVQSSTDATSSVSLNQRTVRPTSEAKASVSSNQRTMQPGIEVTPSVPSTQRTVQSSFKAASSLPMQNTYTINAEEAVSTLTLSSESEVAPSIETTQSAETSGTELSKFTQKLHSTGTASILVPIVTPTKSKPLSNEPGYSTVTTLIDAPLSTDFKGSTVTTSTVFLLSTKQASKTTSIQSLLTSSTSNPDWTRAMHKSEPIHVISIWSIIVINAAVTLASALLVIMVLTAVIYSAIRSGRICRVAPAIPTLAKSPQRRNSSHRVLELICDNELSAPPPPRYQLALLAHQSACCKPERHHHRAVVTPVSKY